VAVAVGLVGLGLAWIGANGGSVPGWEAELFAHVNGLPEGFRIVWPIMQLGSVVGVAVVAIVAGLWLRRVRVAVAVLVAGGVGYGAARAVKNIVARGRPSAFGPIIGRENATGFGFVSGHATVAAAMATVITAWLPRRWRWAPAVVVVVVAFGRMFFGPHFPLDVLGGAALGVAVGSLVNLAVGVLTAPATDAATSVRT
jgi:membrane-associated phospholipid phosphatase